MTEYLKKQTVDNGSVTEKKLVDNQSVPVKIADNDSLSEKW